MSLSKGFAKLFRREIISQPTPAEEGPKIYDGSVMLKDAAQKNNIHLSILVAETAIWANPRMHKGLDEGTAWFPNTRRCRTGQGEKRGEIVDGVKLDDNTYANQAIKRVVGISGDCLVGFESCHIWPNTCYGPRYHTTIANLVLIPRAIAQASLITTTQKFKQFYNIAHMNYTDGTLKGNSALLSQPIIL